MKRTFYTWLTAAGGAISVSASIMLGVTFGSPVSAFEIPGQSKIEQSKQLQLTRQTVFAQASNLEASNEVVIDIPVTAQQKEEIDEIFSSYNPQIEAATRELATALAEVDKVLKPTSMTDDIRSNLQAALEADTNLNSLRFDRLLAIREVLTVAQRREFVQQFENAVRNFQ